MSSSVLTILLILSISLLTLPRQYAVLPLILGTFYVTSIPRIYIGSADFTVARMLILIGFIRIISRREIFNIRMNNMDKLMVLWIIIVVLTGTLRTGRIETLVSKLGTGFNAIGFYFLIRSLAHEKEDVISVIKMISIFLIPLAMLFLLERLSGQNPFAIVGADAFSAVRNGQIRASGPFGHAILAGTAAAINFPLMISLLYKKSINSIASASILAILLIVFSCASSGPIMTLFFGVVGLSFWFLRTWMKQVRVIFWLIIVLLDMFMESRVWFLIARIDLTGGSTGWHRARLLSSAFEHFNEWWLWGTDYTRHWMPTGVSWSPDHVDITNQFIYIGVGGGIFSVFLFIIIIATGFKYVGLMLNMPIDQEERFRIWSLGVVLFAHVATFMSVSYFDQTIFYFYMILALISTHYSNLKLVMMKSKD